VEVCRERQREQEGNQNNSLHKWNTVEWRLARDTIPWTLAEERSAFNLDFRAEEINRPEPIIPCDGNEQ
jgi:hypothetical protein